MAPQDSTKYFVINTATQGELSELGELGDSVFYKRRTSSHLVWFSDRQGPKVLPYPEYKADNICFIYHTSRHGCRPRFPAKVIVI